MVNDKQAYYEHLNESFRQFEEPFFDKLVYKTCLCLSVYTMQIITVEKMKTELSHETKGAYKTHRRNLPNFPAFNKCLATFFDSL